MGASEGHGERIRQGLRRATHRGVVLGGLRPASDQRNQQSHAQALLRALTYRDVLEAGRDKSLVALSRDLAAAGCFSSAGKPLTPTMVRRLRHRLDEANRTLAGRGMKEAVAMWPPMAELRKAAKQRNAYALRWLLERASKECGEPVADFARQVLFVSEDAGWIREVLAEP